MRRARVRGRRGDLRCKLPGRSQGALNQRGRSAAPSEPHERENSTTIEPTERTTEPQPSSWKVESRSWNVRPASEIPARDRLRLVGVNRGSTSLGFTTPGNTTSGSRTRPARPPPKTPKAQRHQRRRRATQLSSSTAAHREVDGQAERGSVLRFSRRFLKELRLIGIVSREHDASSPCHPGVSPSSSLLDSGVFRTTGRSESSCSLVPPRSSRGTAPERSPIRRRTARAASPRRAPPLHAHALDVPRTECRLPQTGAAIRPR